MIFNGIRKTYSTVGDRQYSSIGRFWDKMSEKYGRENLRGLGYNWTDTTIEYVIGLKKGTIPEANCNIELPDEGWTYTEGRTDELDLLYSLIYMEGPLKYEIETFDETGEFVDIQYIRDNNEPDNINEIQTTCFEKETFVNEKKGNLKNFNNLLKSIFDYDPDGPNIHHLLSVHEYSVLIAQMENVDEHTLFITEAAAYLHDIGVKISKEKYGNSQPQHQEEEGPIIARELLAAHGLPSEDVERICFIIGHHHSYKAIDGIDFQILVEADYIVNLMEGYCKRESIPEMKKNVFKTETGKYLLEQMFENV